LFWPLQHEGSWRSIREHKSVHHGAGGRWERTEGGPRHVSGRLPCSWSTCIALRLLHRNAPVWLATRTRRCPADVVLMVAGMGLWTFVLRA